MNLIKKSLALSIVIIMLAALLVGCGGQSVSKEATAALEKAQTTVTEFARNQRRNGAIFTHSIFEKANEAAEKIGDDYSTDNLKKVAEELTLDSITVADENKEILGSYPQDEVGKKLKEIEDKKMFSSIASNNAIEMISDPVFDEESGKYVFMAGVHRADGTGVVIIELKSDEYASVCGADLAGQLGENIVIVKDGVVISSSLEGVKPINTYNDLGITDDDLAKGSFGINVNGQQYKCVSAQSGDYYIICAEVA